MLAELYIKDFAIITELRLEFQPGFNVLTGETGAGKSIIIDAMELLLGGRADSTFIRAGTNAARVEGVFSVAAPTQALLNPVLEAEGLDDPDDTSIITIGRELRASGRNINRINGRTVNLTILRQVGQALIDIHGQSEHLSLLNTKAHLGLVDRFAGVLANRQAFADTVKTLNKVRRDLKTLLDGERDAAQQADLLSFQVDEISAAELVEGEDVELKAERTRLANAEKLASLAEEAIQFGSEGAASDGDMQPSAIDLLGSIVSALERLARVDESQMVHHDQAQTLFDQLTELLRDVQDYRDEIEFNSTRLNEVEERLLLIDTLKRKYGDTITDILAHASDASAQLDRITHSDAHIAKLQAAETELLKTLGKKGVELTKARQIAGATLSKGVMQELQDLRMDRAQFAVDVRQVADENGAILPDGQRVAFDATGIDRVEFLVAPNPGEGLKPMVKVASGGETARLMLSLKGVLTKVDDTETLIFDEIDQGIGGRIGATVGEKLWRLARSHQVLCITHLPQMAGYGDVHFKVEKHIVDERTSTTVRPLGYDERVHEIAQMLGTDTLATQTSAIEILNMVGTLKAA